MARLRGKAIRRRRQPLRGEDAELWDDSDLLNLATMHAAGIAEGLLADMAANGEMVSASTGAALLANSILLHVKGCDDPRCKDCNKHFRPIDFRKLAHQVLEMHLNRAVIINLEVQGSA